MRNVCWQTKPILAALLFASSLWLARASSETVIGQGPRSLELHPNEPVKLTIWTTPNYDWANKLLNSVQGTVDRLGHDNLVFEPNMYIHGGNDICRKNLPTMPAPCIKGCLNNGRYCSEHSEEMDQLHLELTGAEILMESARRQCIWTVNGKFGDKPMALWTYMRFMHSSGCDTIFSAACVNSAYEKSEISGGHVTNCINNGGLLGDGDFDNPLMSGQLSTASQMHVTKAPTVLVNGVVVEVNDKDGSSTETILLAVCAAYPAGSKPDVCKFCADQCVGAVPHCLNTLTCRGTPMPPGGVAGTSNTNTSTVNPNAVGGGVPAVPAPGAPGGGIPEGVPEQHGPPVKPNGLPGNTQPPILTPAPAPTAAKTLVPTKISDSSGEAKQQGQAANAAAEANQEESQQQQTNQTKEELIKEELQEDLIIAEDFVEGLSTLEKLLGGMCMGLILGLCCVASFACRAQRQHEAVYNRILMQQEGSGNSLVRIVPAAVSDDEGDDGEPYRDNFEDEEDPK